MVYLILIILLAFLPIALWGYFLSYFENTPFHARRFVLGVVAWGISVAPILGVETVFSLIGVERFNPFGLAATAGVSGASMIIGLELFVLIISLFILLCGGSLFFENTLKTLGVYARNTFLFALLGSVLWVSYFLFSSPIMSSTYSLSLGDKAIGTVGMVLFYYLLVGFAEEGSKHLSFLASAGAAAQKIKTGILYSLFVSLGFGFLENILYLWNLFQNSGDMSTIFSTWFFRSLFSLFVHLVSGGIVGWFFVRAYARFAQDKNSGVYAKTIMLGISYSLVFHALFDILLTFRFSAVLFFYLLMAYLLFTKLFYGTEAAKNLSEEG